MAELWFGCFEYYHAYRNGNTFNECLCGVGAKSVAHLMKFHLLQWEVVKVKFLMNSNMTLTVLQKTDPKVQQDFQDIAWTRFYRPMSLRQGQITVRP